MTTFTSEVQDGMRIDWDVPIEMDDGVVLRADVFRPMEEGSYPVILSYGPYAKGLLFQEGYKSAWDRMTKAYPEIAEGSTNKYQTWELVDPEKWVPDGYVCVRVDSRGAGRSPGFIDPWCPRETKDYHDCIEWAGTQPWSNGKVGLSGISYYATNQWHVAALKPPHLAAICVWEGFGDYYRDLCRHGGILCEFLADWYSRQVATVQHGVGKRGAKSAVTGELVAGPETLPEEELARNRADVGAEVRERRFVDDYYLDRSARFEDIEVPLLSSGNWGGQGLHPRGNFEGFLRASSAQKWLEVHGNSHFSPFYTNRGMNLQKRFYGHFLKGEDTGWQDQPKIELQVRHPGEKFVSRAESEWPLARTQWTKFHLHADTRALRSEQGTDETTVDYETAGEGVTFWTEPLDEPMEITGPVAAKLFLSSKTNDADVFLALRVCDQEDKEVTFIGSNDPRVPVGLGWLRASHRKLDETRTLPYRPYHTHDEAWPLTPDEPVELDVEIWPTCLVIPAGYRIALNVRGKDYEHKDVAPVADAPYPMKGVGPFLHADPTDRPAETFDTTNTLHFGRDKAPYLLLPVIPAK